MGWKASSYRFRVYLLAGLMVLLVLTALLFTYGLAWYARQTAVDASRVFESRDIERTMADLLLSMERNQRNALLLGRPEYRELYLQDWERLVAKMTELEPFLFSDTERSVLRALQERYEMSGWEQDAPVEAGALMPGRGDTASTTSLGEVQHLMHLNQAQMDLYLERMHLLAHKTLIMGTTLAAVSVLFAGVLSYLLIRSITGPIRRLQKGTREIAAGRFSHRVELPARDELGELAEAFNEMAHQLKKLDELKTDFIAIVSHELKTPLTSMKEAVELLDEEAVGPVNPKQKNLLKVTASGIEKLSVFISDILKLTKLEGGLDRVYAARIDFQALVREKLESFRFLAEKKHVLLSARFEPDPFPTVVGDGVRLRQVLSNLLNNAIQHTGPGGTVALRAAVSKGRSLAHRMPVDTAQQDLSISWVYLSITDSGEGIPREEWNRVFDKFYQIRKETVSSTGSGLGLSIAKHIVEAHNGVIWVEDSSPKGTKLSLAFPQDRAVTEERSEAAAVNWVPASPLGEMGRV